MGSTFKSPARFFAKQGKAPAGGIFDPNPLPVPCGWALSGALYVQQGQSASPASATQFRVDVSPDGEGDPIPSRWFTVLLVRDLGGVLVGVGFSTVADSWIVQLPARTGSWRFLLDDLSSARQLRVAFAEYGAPADPSAIEAEVVLYGSP